MCNLVPRVLSVRRAGRGLVRMEPHTGTPFKGIRIPEYTNFFA